MARTRGWGRSSTHCQQRYRVYASLGLASAALASSGNPRGFDVATGQSGKRGGPQTVRSAAQGIPRDVEQPAPKKGCRGSLDWGQCQSSYCRDVPIARGAQATTSGEANQDEGLGKQSHWQQEPLAARAPGVLTCGRLSAPGH